MVRSLAESQALPEGLMVSLSNHEAGRSFLNTSNACYRVPVAGPLKSLRLFSKNNGNEEKDRAIHEN
jgi:hypothetical protein